MALAHTPLLPLQDPVKYAQYEKAIGHALKDMAAQCGEKGAVVMVVGAGRGPLVKATLRCAGTTIALDPLREGPKGDGPHAGVERELVK